MGRKARVMGNKDIEAHPLREHLLPSGHLLDYTHDDEAVGSKCYCHTQGRRRQRAGSARRRGQMVLS